MTLLATPYKTSSPALTGANRCVQANRATQPISKPRSVAQTRWNAPDLLQHQPKVKDSQSTQKSPTPHPPSKPQLLQITGKNTKCIAITTFPNSTRNQKTRLAPRSSARTHLPSTLTASPAPKHCRMTNTPAKTAISTLRTSSRLEWTARHLASREAGGSIKHGEKNRRMMKRRW